MYETNLSSVVTGQAADAGATRAFAWDELVAKLAAARDLRGVFSATRGDSLASFAPHAARALATREAGKERVNPDALGAGKGARGMTAASAGGVGGCDREMR